jgi:hypothetical protein
LDFKHEQTSVERTVEILRAQIDSTNRLRAHVQQTELKLGKSDSRVADLLRSISRELWAIIELTTSRASALGKRGSGLLEVNGDAPQSPSIDDEDNLEDLLNRFCRYERNTSDRLALARGWHDSQTVMLLDRILSIANASIRFLDIYSCAMWLRCEESDLPTWKPFRPAQVPVEHEKIPTTLSPNVETLA